MPIHMGIMCDACRKVHFIVTSRGIKLSERVEGMYLLTYRRVPKSGSSEKKACTHTASKKRCSKQGMQRKANTNSFLSNPLQRNS